MTFVPYPNVCSLSSRLYNFNGCCLRFYCMTIDESAENQGQSTDELQASSVVTRLTRVMIYYLETSIEYTETRIKANVPTECQKSLVRR